MIATLDDSPFWIAMKEAKPVLLVFFRSLDNPSINYSNAAPISHPRPSEDLLINEDLAFGSHYAVRKHSVKNRSMIF